MQNLNIKIQAQFDLMCKTGKLFRVEMTGREIWDLYLKSFENDLVFRDPASSEHNCNLCNNFIRRYGNIVAISADYKVMSIFDVELPGEYDQVVKALSSVVTSSKVTEVFFETFGELNSLNYEKCNKSAEVFRLGIAKNHKRYTKEEAEKFGVVKADETRAFNHFHLDVPKMFVDQSGKSVESIMGDFRGDKNVFQRAMEEISLDTLNLVKDLITQDSLLDGATHLYKVEQFIPLKKEYDELPLEARDNWCWIKSYQLPFAKFKNELIGVLCSELAEGEELNKACQSWNKRVDPINFMRVTAPFTEKQKKEAVKIVEEGGYTESFDRRFATLDDIKASEIKHMNVSAEVVKNASMFDGLKSVKPSRHKRNEFDGIEEVSIDKFMTAILPGCTSVEAYLENKHAGNLVTLTTAKNPESKPMFKWDNNYSWTFNGNIAGKSQIKEAVKSRGGETEGVLRVSMSFPNTTDDYDLHMVEPNGNEIYYSNLRITHRSSGRLDLDAQGRDGEQVPEKRVENIIYTDKHSMPNGKYTVFVNNYSGRGLHTPCTFEIEAEGEVTIVQLKVNPGMNKVPVCTIDFYGDSFTLIPSANVELIDSKTISKELYGLNTNEFHKVNLVSLSPNHWDGQQQGNKHFMFMLEGCKTPVSIRSFHAENLIPELYEQRRVLEPLGATMMLEPGGKQLSGLGFNATVRDELIVKLSGNFRRTIKIKF